MINYTNKSQRGTRNPPKHMESKKMATTAV
jgi:hypothetical protein